MASITVTVTTIDSVTPPNSLQELDTKDIIGMTSSDNLTTGTAVIDVRRMKGTGHGAVEKIERWVTTQSFATVKAAANAADAEAGAQLLTGKDATGGYAGLTLLKINFLNALGTFTSFFTNSNTAARTYTFPDETGTVITNQSKDATGGYAGLTLFKINFKNVANTFTSFFTNSNTAARTYTFPDEDGTVVTSASKDATGGVAGLTLFKLNLKNAANTFTNFFTNTTTAARTWTMPDVTGTVAVGAKIPATALVGGELVITDANVSTTSIANISKRALGGTYAPSYKVVCTASTVTITALQSDGTTQEVLNTDSIMGWITY